VSTTATCVGSFLSSAQDAVSLLLFVVVFCAFMFRRVVWRVWSVDSVLLCFCSLFFCMSLPMDWDLLAFVFELGVLCACASLCASVMDIPTTAYPYQDSPQWRRLSDVAAAAAVAATEEGYPCPSRETAKVIQMAARAATAAAATAFGRDPVAVGCSVAAIHMSGRCSRKCARVWRSRKRCGRSRSSGASLEPRCGARAERRRARKEPCGAGRECGRWGHLTAGVGRGAPTPYVYPAR